MIRVGVLGASGKTGSQVVLALSLSPFSKTMRLCGEFNRQSGLQKLKNCDLIIDFSRPEYCLEALSSTLSPPTWVVGSTGWTDEQFRELHLLSKSHLILRAANFALGIAWLGEILSQAASLTGLGFKTQIHETHHTHKKDSPSGTALWLKDQLQKSGVSVPQIDAVREGEVIGLHEVIFSTPHEKITLKHEALDRKLFALGALEAAQWLSELKKSAPDRVGLLSLSDFFKKN